MRDLGALLEKLAVDCATVVGLSVGGLIAQELYRQRPRAFAALVLCDTAAKIGNDKFWDARIAEVEEGASKRSQTPFSNDGLPPTFAPAVPTI